MNKKIIIALFLSLLCFQSIAQKLQFGLTLRAAAPQLFLEKKNFDKSVYKYIPAVTSGFGGGGNYYINRKINIYSGLNFQLKSYAARLYNFDIPNVEGFISFRPMSACLEMPIVLFYEKARKKKENSYINYGAGIVLSYTKPLMTTIRQKGPLFSEIPERDTLLSAFDSQLNKSLYFSYDLYLGISFVKKIKQRRIFEWGFSYQYAFKKSANLSVDGYIYTFNASKSYSAIFNPKLSNLVIHITFYPKRFIVL